MLVGWTGHRSDVFQSPDEARQRLERLAEHVLARWTNVTFLCGGQRGVDTWAAETATTRGVPFRIVLPVPPGPFTEGWNDRDREALAASMACAADVRTVDRSPPLPPGGPVPGMGAALAYDRR